MTELDQLKPRLEGVRDAMQRGRAAIFLSTLASLACLLAVWNNYFSWDLLLLDSAREKSRIAELASSSAHVPADLKGQYKPMDEIANEELVRNFIDNQKLSLSILGMSVSSGDLLILGSAGMFLVSVYCFLCLRRSNYEIGSLLAETTMFPKDYWRYVYFGIRSSMVLNVLSYGDAPYVDLGHPSQNSRPVLTVRGTVRALAYMPSITIAVAFASDVLYSFQVRRGQNRFLQLDRRFQAQLIVGLLIGIVLFVVTLRLNLQTDQFGAKMKILMRKFRSEYCSRFGGDIFNPAAGSERTAASSGS